MEMVLGALETAEAAAKATPFADNVTADDIFVDELLDFSNGFSEGELGDKEQEQRETESVSREQKLTATGKYDVHGNDDFGSLPCSELSEMAEGLDSLEWLSHFIEDSFSDHSLTGRWPHSSSEHLSPPAEAARRVSCFTTPVQTKARTKRVRTGSGFWPVLSPSMPESSSSSSSSTTSFSPSPPTSIQRNPLATKQREKPGGPPASCGGGGGVVSQPRRCSHCGVTKTPQWRAGPMGSKTLCNACGVRYKSGRLLPEYRPACSPTFSLELHSNNHRKVLEMRRRKESEVGGSGLTSPVQSF